jgi:hypothetical protein
MSVQCVRLITWLTILLGVIGVLLMIVGFIKLGIIGLGLWLLGVLVLAYIIIFDKV